MIFALGSVTGEEQLNHNTRLQAGGAPSAAPVLEEKHAPSVLAF